MRRFRIPLTLGVLAVFFALLMSRFGQEQDPHHSPQKTPGIFVSPDQLESADQASQALTSPTLENADTVRSINTEHCNVDKVFEEHVERAPEEGAHSYLDPEELLQALADSDNPDDLAVMTMMREILPAARIKKSNQVLTNKHPNKIALVSLLRSCAEKPELSECGDQLRHHVRNVNEQNGAYWFMLSNVLLAQGNERGALALLSQAASAPQYDTLWTTAIVAFDLALKRHFDFPEYESANHAFGLASAVALDNYQPVFELCKREGVSFTHQRSVCAGFAEQLENNGMTLFDLTIGLVLQFRMAQLEGDKELVESIEARRAANRQKQKRNLEATAALLLKGIDIPYDPALTLEYLQGLSVFGELPMLDFPEQVFERQFGPLPECS